MPRSVNAVASRARKKKVLKQTKGNFLSRKNVFTVAYRDRKKKKGHFRSLWIQRINAGVRQYDMSYSEFIGKLDKKGITLNRKTLADLAMHHPEAFKAIVEKVK
jgi:large subunit ribosomal protein L20